MIKKITLFASLILVLVSCELGDTVVTQQDVVDKVTAEVKKSMAKPESFDMTECTIDTINSNSSFIDPDSYPDLYGAALYMKLVRMSSDLYDKTEQEEDFQEFSANLDSVRNYMKPVMARYDVLKKQESKPAGYIVCIEYKDGDESKAEVWYYDIATGNVEKKSWEPEVFGQMQSLLEEFAEKPELLNDDKKE